MPPPGIDADSGELLPCGDALADPLTGVTAAAVAVAAEALLADHAVLLDVSMHHVCAEVAGPVPPHEVIHRDGRWWVTWTGGDVPVELPEIRRSSRTAGELGADTWRVLGRRGDPGIARRRGRRLPR